MSIYEIHGRLVEQYQEECEQHARTVAVLRALKQGEVSLDQLTVGDDNTWQIAPNTPLFKVIIEQPDEPDAQYMDDGDRDGRLTGAEATAIIEAHRADRMNDEENPA